ncbi:hypothetical protein CUMW_179110 [Citrus unshiu]|uniref:Protein kinase domain-containing protein n=1 Tax=Citrus unshiu TaxID=55188 RepID=A0A2H5PYG7_CITUN|nr:hypothetical protein CUMW_179110 [Citrus unshiu]
MGILGRAPTVEDTFKPVPQPRLEVPARTKRHRFSQQRRLPCDSNWGANPVKPLKGTPLPVEPTLLVKIKIKIEHSVFSINQFAVCPQPQMGSIMRKFKDRIHKRALMMRNGASVLKELIASSNSKYYPYRIFSTQEIKLATNNYDQKNVIAKDTSYNLYTMYKGFWQERLISVSQFHGHECRPRAYESCINNVTYATQMSHNNILKLIGCCLETPIPVLVFESAQYETLWDRILGAPQPHFEPLLLKRRLKIAMDIAHALAYLHFGFPRPIKFQDIMNLINEENDAKLFDFSLSISIPEGETHITDTVMGTWGYCSPEYMRTGVFNEKSDVFSFGVFLFELLTGWDVSDLVKDAHDLVCPFNEYLKNYFEDNRFTEIVDPIIVEDVLSIEKEQQLHASAQVTFECIKDSPADRPSMSTGIFMIY